MIPKNLYLDNGTHCQGKILFQNKNNIDTCNAFLLGNKSDILLYVPRSLGALNAKIEIYTESLDKQIFTLDGEWSTLDGGLDVYTFRLDTKKLGVGLYFYRPVLKTPNSLVFGCGNKRAISFTHNPDKLGLLQLSVSDFLYDQPNQMYGGIIYHIFVDRFARGGEVPISDGAILKPGEWSEIPEYPEYPGAPLKNNTFYGGTLYGITEKLDYIASLGVTAIYLSPIFSSVSNHKYDTADYTTVDEMFGGERALKKLIVESERRGIKIILDGVFNHTGADSIYFNRYGRFNTLGAYESKESPYYSWYDFQNHPNQYTCWWDIEILPRINPDKSECGDYFVGNGGVIEKYSKMGVYGFRLDVADELSDDFIGKIKKTLSGGGESVLYGEVWEDASNKIAYDKRKKYYLGGELDGVMNYPVRVGIIDYLTTGKTDSLYYALTEIIDNSPKRILDAQMNLLGTHDTERIITVLGAESDAKITNAQLVSKRMAPNELEVAIKRLKMAYTILATLPGIPTIFYGDEAGLEGYHDPFNRMPYPWGRENEELLCHYRKVGEIRRNSKVFSNGKFELHELADYLLVFSRKSASTVYLTVVNNGKYEKKIEFSENGYSELHNKRDNSFTQLPHTAEIYKISHKTTVTIK